jgi:hypothetical protein
MSYFPLFFFVMTPEHKFQLGIAVLTITPATILSLWALVNQRRQTTPRLKILPSPITMKSITGKTVFVDQWPGIVVLNHSPFPVRVCNVGYCIGRRHYTFGKPLLNEDSALINEAPWPWEIEPRSRAAFHPDLAGDGQDFVKAITPALNGKPVLAVARAYAISETAGPFYSKRLSRKSLGTLQQGRSVD